MQLLDAVRALGVIDPDMVVSDGGADWSVDNLLDALLDGGAAGDPREYVLEDRDIYLIDSRGYRGEIPVFCGW